ncbi:hypothetical protein [Aliiruegeria sabulilitoris]|uniref:hypothetical protein n=1 Tax=Aliiruegeria sabulilitoris TaxID=1510458 RepID=UPI0012E3353F|nr:hypothetical protein [Aliiruegeria sabulilitoris]NDR55712.1 hypothetical protein [Pseudoruegeria sp. M32A2M]
MKTRLYASAGLVIESDFALPGLGVAAIGDGVPHLRYQRTPSALEPLLEPGLSGPCWSYDSHNFHFTAPEIAEFRISPNGTVLVWPLTDNYDDIAAYLVGSVLGIALHLRKIIALHASAVEVDGGAVLFCGESGAGKSTMAAALQQHGYPVLCDDLCAIEITNSGAIVHSDGRKLKLWEQAIAQFRLDEQKGDPVQQGFEKYYVDAGTGRRRSLPVRGFFALADRPSTALPRISAVTTAEAAALIRDNAYRPFLVEHLKDEVLYFGAAAALLRQAGVFRLERARDFDQLALVIEALQDHWRNTGLA